MGQQTLDELCEKIAGCETLAFIDVSTRMVLLKNAASPESQDFLNAMCREASFLLEGGTTAMVTTKDRLKLFLRSEIEPTDVLCCICAVDTEIKELIPAAKDCLSAISTGD
ncbi:MAG: hypothetical protein AAGK67_12520 [Pseudomonadota bacterium]